MEVFFKGNIFDVSGYAEVSRAIVAGLTKLGAVLQIEPSAVPMVRVSLEPELESLLVRLANNRVSHRAVVLENKPASSFEVIPGRYNIGITMLEADRLTPQWVYQCNRMDEVWVPSHFNQETFIRSGVSREKVKVFPFGVDPNRFTPDGPAYPIPGQHGYTFLSVSDWHRRKGWDILVKAFCNTFSASDDVCLILKITNTMGADFSGIPAEVDKLAREHRADPPTITVWSQNVSRYDMPSFYRSANCFALASHGEGWSMPTIEAMSTGLPAIITNWSGHTEYANPGNALMINVECFEPVPPVDQFNDYVYKGAMWARPSCHHLGVLLRSAFENRAGAQHLGRLARESILANFTWDAACQRMSRHLAALRSRFGRVGYYTRY